MSSLRNFSLIGVLFFVLAIFMPGYAFLPNKFYLLCLSIVFAGWHIFRSACISVAKFQVDANVLITIAIIGLISLSMLLEAAIYICLIGVMEFIQSVIAKRTLSKLEKKWRSSPEFAPKVVDGQEGTQSLFSRMGEIVAMTASSKAAMETVNYNQGWAKRILTVIFFMSLPFFFFKMSLMTWLNYSITLLLIFAPYNALIEAAGLLAAQAVDKAAEFGIIVNEPLALEEAVQVKAVAFDKESTIATGEQIMCNIYAPYPFTRQEVVSVAKAVTAITGHPFAASIDKGAQEAFLPADSSIVIVSDGGFNVQAQIDGKAVVIGSNAFLEQNGVKTSALLRKYAEYLNQGATVLFIALGGEPAGLLSFIKDVNPQIYMAVSAIKTSVAPDVIMLTKELERVNTISKTKPYGFTEVVSGINDAVKKVPAIQKLRFSYGELLVVGDARYDTTIMQNADLSVAVNVEKDVRAAEQTADILLFGNYFSALPRLFALGKGSITTLSLYKRLALLAKLTLLALAFLSYLYLWQIVLIDGILGVLLVLYCTRK